MNNFQYKVVGASGQISLGKSLAGTAFLLEPLAGGDYILKKASVIPSNEKWIFEPSIEAKIERADAWMRENPASATNIDDLESDLTGKMIGEEKNK